MADDWGTSLFNHAASHEPGHVYLGLAHDGINDNITASGFSEPLMRGCGGTPIFQSADDWARTSYTWDRSITPNGGFENTGIWLGSFNQITNPVEGSYNAEVASGTSISRPTRVTPTLGAGYRFRGSYKHNGPGSGTFKFNYRAVDYPTGSTCGGPYFPDTLNWNAPTVGAWVTALNWGLGTSTGWSDRNAAIPSLPAADAIDYSVIVAAPLTQSIYVDDVEIYTT